MIIIIIIIIEIIIIIIIIKIDFLLHIQGCFSIRQRLKVQHRQRK